jgi:hypothetical protein
VVGVVVFGAVVGVGVVVFDTVGVDVVGLVGSGELTVGRGTGEVTVGRGTGEERVGGGGREVVSATAVAAAKPAAASTTKAPTSLTSP